MEIIPDGFSDDSSSIFSKSDGVWPETNNSDIVEENCGLEAQIKEHERQARLKSAMEHEGDATWSLQKCEENKMAEFIQPKAGASMLNVNCK